MARAVTLFTGQWADLSFDVVCKKAKQFGYDGIELACFKAWQEAWSHLPADVEDQWTFRLAGATGSAASC